MIIAVMSDLHDNAANWELLNQAVAAQHLTVLLNVGDTCAPAMLQGMAESFSGHIHSIFGNVADRAREQEIVQDLKNVTHYGDAADFMLDGKRIGMAHTPHDAQALIKAGGFDIVCHGHTHLKRWEKVGQTYILNPGTAGGMFQYPSFATVDLQTMSCEFHEIVQST